MSRQSDELKRYFALNNIRVADVAEKIGMHQSTVSLMINGKQELSKNAIVGLAKSYGFDTYFLLTGEGSLMAVGSKVSAQNSAELSAATDTIAELTKEKQSLKARIFRLLALIEEAGIPCHEAEK